jgi:predicted acyl esterase
MPWEGASDHYRELARHGGILNTFISKWYPHQVASVQHGVGDRGAVNPNTGEPVAGPESLSEEELAKNRADAPGALLDHPLDDQYHRDRSADFSRITVPLLSATNWAHQLHTRGNFEAYVQSVSQQKWLEVHGLEHWTHFYTDYGVRLQKRFFGHFLKGEDTGWDSQPPVLLQVRHADGTFTERAEEGWPIPRTEWTRWELGTGSYEALGDGITFTGDPLERETEITGPSAAKLFVSSSTEDADLFVVLRAFDPDVLVTLTRTHARGLEEGSKAWIVPTKGALTVPTMRAG